MESEVLTAEQRAVRGSQAAMKLRRAGSVPAVLYGHGGANVLLSVNRHDLEMVLQHGVRVLDLKVGEEVETVVIKEVQYDGLGDAPCHVDFGRIAIDEKVELEIPIVLAGLAPGVESGGILDHPISDLEIECLPTQVPESIRVSIRKLEIGDSITVGDLEVPEGVTVLTEASEVVAIIHPPVKPVEEEEVEAEEGPAEPEVIGEKEREEAAKEETGEKN